MFKAPYKELVPPLAIAEFEALKASIEADRAVHDPIWIDEQNNILDGHHRHLAVEELRDERELVVDLPTRVRAGLSEPEKKAFVLACSMRRRNLSLEQKDELRQSQIAVAKELRAAGKSQADIGLALGVTQQAVSLWFAPNTSACNRRVDNRMKLTGEECAEIHERVEGDDTHEQIAADYGISRQHVSRVHKNERKRRAREQEINEQEEAIARGEITGSNGPYDVIVIDPPWPYDQKYHPETWRGTSPYPEMTLEEIADQQLEPAEHCILWLWTTHRFLPHAFSLLKQWGFEYKVVLTWVKDRMGLGRWLRSQSEYCLMAVKGKPEINLTNQTTILNAPTREHSRKPDEFYEMVKRLCPAPRRVDWFSREPRPGWLQHGNDTFKFGGAGPTRDQSEEDAA